MKDQKIINLILEGNELGFIKLANKYEKLLFYIAKSILGNRIEDVEECVNDTYLKLWNNIDKYDSDKASLKTYLIIIVRNTAINKLRDLSKHEKNQISDDITDIAKYYIDNKQNLEKSIFDKEDLSKLNTLIKNLKSVDQEIIIRKYFYLQSSKHIARVMDMTVTAVDSRSSRTRKILQKEFEKEDEEVIRKENKYE
ncbi:MAG: sigma-70 family RNA polymerase sigma factor [Clostridiales bacterium]|nr:sigma-70 family RNA polymerase sigma factor [Clostridiales bacterium]